MIILKENSGKKLFCIERNNSGWGQRVHTQLKEQQRKKKNNYKQIVI